MRHAIGLASLGLAALACSGSKGSYALGADLRQLPRAGASPLLALVPERALLAVAVHDPNATWRLLQDSPVAEALGSGPWRDLQALPQVERWHALRARLSELARQPLPGLAGLLDAPSVVAWVPADPSALATGWLYVAKIDEGLPRVWALARALNVVRPSARDVEVERVGGLPIRDVSIGGGGHVAYAILGDRLLIASDAALVTEAVALAFDPKRRTLASHPPFSDLEVRAALVGTAAAIVPHGEAALWPGIDSLELDGTAVDVKLDSALWRAGEVREAPNPSAIFRLELAGLDGSAWLSKITSSAQRDDLNPLLAKINALGPQLGRGVFAQIVPWQTGVGVSVDVVRHVSRAAMDAGNVSLQSLAQVLLSGVKAAEAEGTGKVWCSEDDEVCLLDCPSAIRLSWPGNFARAAGCPGIQEFGANAASELALWMGGPDGGVGVQIRDGRGQLTWTAP